MPSKTREVQSIVRRLQRMDVEVNQLTAPLAVSDYKPYGRARQAVTLPAGTYWIPMAQMQKHWVQAMLNEDTYTPFPYFYDVTGWSQPLLFNVQGGSSGLELSPAASPAPELGDPGERRSARMRPRWRCSRPTAARARSSPRAGCATCSSAAGACAIRT